MNPEHRLVPYACGELPPGPWLVFAPHADDETFGMGGSLARAAAAGIATHVVVLTDGALGGSGADLVATRHREVQTATMLLGVTSLDCWTEPDRGLARRPELLAQVRDTIARLQPASVFFPGPLELHPDHRMTLNIVWDVLRGLQEPPGAYGYEISVQNPVNLLIDITTTITRKQQAMAVYVSQNGLNDYPDLITAMNVTRTFTLPAGITHAEGYYRFSAAELAAGPAVMLRDWVALYV